MVSNAMNQLTVEGRAKVLAELHGVAESRMESPENMEELLMAMELAVQEKKRKGGADSKAYVMAELKDREFVSDREFRMKFILSLIHI